MSSQRVLPASEIAPARATCGPLSGAPDVPPALPLSSEAFVAPAATPFLPDVVEHGGGITTARLGGR